LRTWFIEDAGGGCRAFSEVVVLVSEDPVESYTAQIPLTWNGGESLEEVACRAVAEMMEKAGVKVDDHILVCSGNIFHGLHAWLTEHKYNWEFARMDGLAHDIAEDAFYRQIVKAGFPPHIKLTERNYRDFYRVVEKWITEDESRHSYMKDRLVRQKPVETRYVLKANSARKLRCCGCNKNIMPYSPVVEFKARLDGKKVRKCYHPECSPVTPLKNKLPAASGKINGALLEGLLSFCRKETNCGICSLNIIPDSLAFYAYRDGKLLICHPGCVSAEYKR
jgi:hypothetical protein